MERRNSANTITTSNFDKKRVDFEKLETYIQKLEYWKENIYFDLFSYRYCCKEGSDSNPIDLNSAEAISIEPETPVERKVFVEDCISNDSITSLENIKFQYEEMLNSSINPFKVIEYEKNELREAIQKLDIIRKNDERGGRNSEHYGEVLGYFSEIGLAPLNFADTVISDSNCLFGILTGIALARRENIIENFAIPLPKNDNKKSQLAEFSNLSWENKTELSELIYCLAKSKRILDNGIPITQTKLIAVFETTFNVNLSKYYTFLSSGMTTNKKTLDNEFFMGQLLELAKKWEPKSFKKD